MEVESEVKKTYMQTIDDFQKTFYGFAQTEIDPITYFRNRIQEEEYLRLKKKYEVPSYSLVLDVGCAFGPSWPLLIGMHAVGIDVDLNEEIMGRAKHYGVDIILADATNLPLRDGTIAIVLCQEILEHLGQPIIALHEISRVLKKYPGILLVDVPCLLDKVTVPALTPIVVFCEKLARLLSRKIINRRNEVRCKGKEKDLTSVKKDIFKALRNLPTHYLSKITSRLLWLLLTVNFCKKEHRNKYAWSWVSLIENSGFTIERVQGCAIFYLPLLISSDSSHLYLYEKKFRARRHFKFLGQLLCISARRATALSHTNWSERMVDVRS